MAQSSSAAKRRLSPAIFGFCTALENEAIAVARDQRCK
jgi:hypothetical protein